MDPSAHITAQSVKKDKFHVCSPAHHGAILLHGGRLHPLPIQWQPRRGVSLRGGHLRQREAVHRHGDEHIRDVLHHKGDQRSRCQECDYEQCEPNLCQEKGKSFQDCEEFGLRWFTPTNEVPLCGHATLAAATVLFRVSDA